ncbi:CshA/CshB family fibrillar adhesin-related protein [Dokdonella sp.]|uniref:CshA/CshB family fibrillar adhesin-related protein n=1 Tax=Dokdonella sp. TaxID=2291710 RepID=UPI001B09DE48|nr:CshA/CshB family fibrillar adhesin-related protein [Dokdonella sp.]MBO9664655.1 hypothetical protein [Dokdonella sp.]
MRLALARSLAGAGTLIALALMPSPALAQYATGGSGLYRGNIVWFSWGSNGQAIPAAGTTVTNNYSIAGRPLSVQCSIGSISGAIYSYRPGQFSGDGLDDLYNIGGGGGANALIIGVATSAQLATFNFTCSATLDGQPFALGGLVFADAETNGSNEYIRATIPAGSTLRAIERYRAGCTGRYQVTADAAGTTYTTSSPDNYCVGGAGPMMVGFIDGATSGTVGILGGGVTAVALGVMMDGADYGDAPAGYGEAVHLLQSSWSGGTVAPNTTQDIFAANFTLGTLRMPAVRLGDLVDADIANQPSANAGADDTTGLADEDGLVPGSVLLVPGATTAQATVRAVNATASPVTLAGWIDVDRNGSFDAAERAQITVPANTTTPTPFTLNWSGLPPIAGGASTFARFRIATQAADVAAPAGLARDGEVEDHRVPIAAQITVTKVPTALDDTPFAFTTTAAAPNDAFTLSSGTTLTRTFYAGAGTVAIEEGGNAGWALIDITCSNTSGAATFTYIGATANPSSGFERGDDTANVTVGFGDQVTCTYTNAPTALPTLAKFFNTDPPSDPAPQPPVIPRSGAALLTFVISNRAPSASAQNNLAFTDTLPPGLVLANGSAPPSALVGANTCGGTVTAQAGTNAITLAGGNAAAGTDCSFTVRVGSAP